LTRITTMRRWFLLRLAMVVLFSDFQRIILAAGSTNKPKPSRSHHPHLHLGDSAPGRLLLVVGDDADKRPDKSHMMLFSEPSAESLPLMALSTGAELRMATSPRHLQKTGAASAAARVTHVDDQQNTWVQVEFAEGGVLHTSLPANTLGDCSPDQAVRFTQVRGPPSVNIDTNGTITFSHFEAVGAPCAGASSGKIFYEVEILTESRNYQFGWATDRFDTNIRIETAMGVGDCNHSWAIDGGRLKLWHNGHGKLFGATRWKKGDVVGLAADLDRGELSFALNGVWNAPSGKPFRCLSTPCKIRHVHAVWFLQSDLCLLTLPPTNESGPPYIIPI
jgi:hypothetical protein